MIEFVSKLGCVCASLILVGCCFYTSGASASDQLSTCEVNVGNGFTYSGMCLKRSNENAAVIYLLSASVVSHQTPEHFFYLPHGSRAEATWNMDPASSHAHDYLGTFEQSEDCYIGATFSVCSSPLWE